MVVRQKIYTVTTLALGIGSLFSALLFSSAVSADNYDPPCKAGDTLTQIQLSQGIMKPVCTTNPGGGTSTPTAPEGQPTTEEQAGGGGNASTSEGPADGTTCAVEKVGWIVCPVIESAAKVGDFLFRFLANNFLQVDQSLYKSDPNNGTMVSWGIARNFANILFIIAFLFIIYSQITGAALGNYGIKRMLPRLIVAAILVNVSFYICQFMVDVSNILGYNIKKLLVDTAQTISTTSAMPVVDGGFANVTNSDGVLGMIATAALLGATVWILLGPLVGIIGLIVITCIIIVIILLLRKTLIILLIVASPIAFVAYLLPNTEKFFKKWLDMFWKLLMVFPVVALLLGGGQLASAIILSAGTSSNVDSSDSYKIAAEERCVNLADGKTGTVPDEECDPAGKGGPGIMLALVAAGVAVAPMLAVISVLKAALAGAGALGGKIAGAVESRSKQGAGALSKSSVGRGIAARKAIKQNYKDQKFAEKMSGSKKRGRFTRIAARGVGGNVGMMANKLNNGTINKVTGGLRAQDSKLSANFAGASAKIEDQDVKDRQSLLNSQMRQNAVTGGDPNEKYLGKKLEESIINGDLAGAKAAEELLTQQGKAGVNEIRELFKRIGTETKFKSDSAGQTVNGLKSHIAQTQSSLKGSDADVYSYAARGGSQEIDPTTGATHTWTMENIQADAGTYKGITNEQLASQSAYSINNTGATSALSTSQKMVLADGSTTNVSRARVIIGSDAAKNIKAENRDVFDRRV
ncbi:hypothetical protein I8H84_05500 [Candidatus Saccharibacteria bacterium]|nr:hypothetical protein [Candidatus Saccharibacteria bacterium]MBH1973208.1 hypothetical protein [Candidatus Saccharibacteria bacterium]MBH1990551.1 hypothetical protein [Candidatus Saccharibacteria bacterium]